MIISLDETTRITSNENCWQLERRRKRNGSADWQPYKYYSTFGAALGEACEREIRTHPANTIADAIEATHTVTQKYAEIFGSVEFRPHLAA